MSLLSKEVKLTKVQLQILLIVLASVVASIAAVSFVSSRFAKLDHRIVSRFKDANDLARLAITYSALKATVAHQASSGFVLFTFLSDAAKKYGIDKNISSIKPYTNPVNGDTSESVVEVNFDGIPFTDYFNYCYDILANPNKIVVKKNAARRRSDGSLYDISMTVSILQKQRR